MRIFLAGATGAIGRPLTARLLADGHEVTAMTRSPESARALEGKGITAVIADAFNSEAVTAAITTAAPEVLIHQLTALPTSGGAKKFAAGLRVTSRLRRETVPVMLEAAAAAGARRAIVQSISFVTAPDGRPVHDESAPLWTDSPDETLADSISAVADMERSVEQASLDGVVLRYGFFTGPGTAWGPGGQLNAMLRRRIYPVVAEGQGRMSFVHIDDAVDATLAALERGAPGVYNITEPDPQPVRDALNAAAKALGARAPRTMPTWMANMLLPASLVHYSTTLAGNDSSLAERELGWRATKRWPEGL